MDIPVLLMGFNRPDLLTRALESLREQGVQNLYVSLDGPRFEDEIGSCEECFKCVQQYRDSFQLKVLSRSSNLGCYLGVISNIDWFFSQVNFGIIIEDDCVVDEEFFRKAQEYLDTLELFLGHGVGMITAHNPFVATEDDLITEYFLSNQGAGSYYFNNPITAKVIQQFNLKKIITKIKKPHSPLPFNDKLFVKYYCYYYKTLRADDNKLVFSVGTHSDKVVIFFSSSVEFMDKEIFRFWQ